MKDAIQCMLFMQAFCAFWVALVSFVMWTWPDWFFVRMSIGSGVFLFIWCMCDTVWLKKETLTDE